MDVLFFVFCFFVHAASEKTKQKNAAVFSFFFFLFRGGEFFIGFIIVDLLINLYIWVTCITEIILLD